MRFWIICAIYFVGFFLSAFDHVPFIVAVRHLIAPSIVRGTPNADLFSRIVILAGAFLAFLSAGLRTWAAAYLRTYIVHDTSQHSDALIADGPFRYTRNPLYFGNLRRWRWESAFLPVDLVLYFWSRRTGFLFIGLFFAKKKRFGKTRENRIEPISRRCRASGRRFGREFLQPVANRNGGKRSRGKVLSGSSGWPNYRSESH